MVCGGEAAALVSRLLLQGTKKYNSEELANEFEKYAIDFSSDLFPNYLRLNFLCLNEDFSKAIELMNEVITNSTFDEIEKEGMIKGEAKGKAEGIIAGIQALIESLQEMEVPYTKTQNQLMVKFSLSEDTAQEYMDKFWK